MKNRLDWLYQHPEAFFAVFIVATFVWAFFYGGHGR